MAADARGALEVVHFEVRHRIEGLHLVAPHRRLPLSPPPHMLQHAVPFWGASGEGGRCGQVRSQHSRLSLQLIRPGTAVIADTMLSSNSHGTGLSRCSRVTRAEFEPDGTPCAFAPGSY